MRLLKGWMTIVITGILTLLFSVVCPGLADAGSDTTLLPASARPVRPGQKPITISFWHSWDGPRLEQIRDLLRRFQAAYPWITVKEQLITWGPERNDKILVAFAGGAPPDVVMVYPWDVSMLCERGMLSPIEEIMRERRVPVEAFYPGSIRPVMKDGHVWALPATGPAIWGMAYNRDLFAEAGLPDRAPGTWVELLSFNRKLTRCEGNMIVRLGADIGQSIMYFNFLYSNTGKYITDDARHILFDSPESVSVLRYGQEFYTQLPGGGWGARVNFFSRYSSTAGPQFPFFLEKMAMHFCGPPDFSVKAFSPDLDFGVGPTPYNDQNPKAHSAFMGLPGWVYAVSAPLSPERVYAAYLLAEWLTAEESAGGWFMKQQTRISPVIQFNQDPWYAKNIRYWPTWVKIMNTLIPVPVTPVHQQLESVAGLMWQDALSAKAPPEQVVEKAQLEAQGILDRYYKEVGK